MSEAYSGDSGGPAGLIYGYIIAWIGMTCVYTTLGELASMIPTSGGQYHWVSIFAPAKGRIFLSYVCGKVFLTSLFARTNDNRLAYCFGMGWCYRFDILL